MLSVQDDTMQGSSISDVSTIVYFSSVSGNTHRFIEKLGRPAQRIPLYSTEPRCMSTSRTCSSSPPTGAATGGARFPNR